MTLSDDELIEPMDDVADGPRPRRRNITDVDAWLAGCDTAILRTLQTLGELLTGVFEREDSGENAERFTARCLGVSECGHLLDESRPLNGVSRLTDAVALAEWIAEYSGICEIGSGQYNGSPPRWTQTEVGQRLYRYPSCLRVYFPAGTLLADTDCVIGIGETMMHRAEVSVYVRADAQNQARDVLDRLAERGRELNPYRGRALRATYTDGLSLAIINLPSTASRRNVIVPVDVWAEVDLSVTAVRDRHAVLNTHGLGTRRGVLLCGPPGTGKSAVSAVIANELVGEFSVIYVDAQAGAALLTVVVEEAQRLGGPVLLVVEDVDLWCQRRGVGGGAGLSELLQAMDIQPEARILTLASTNDPATLDAAAIRTGRFDSIVAVGYPDRSDAAKIVAAFSRGLPGGETIDSAAVAAVLPEQTSGSDIREIVRRALLANEDGYVSTARLLAEVGSGRYRTATPEGLVPVTPDEKNFPELSDAEKARWAAARSDMQEMSSGLQDGTTTREDIHGALNRLMSTDIDQQKLTNALHVLPGAGPYSAVLEQILRRIPDDWGRWISHDAGWYAIIATLDERLSALDSDYEVHQIKEKFGTLRYYCRPSDDASNGVWKAFESLVIEAESLSARTCECCGEPGLLHGTTYRVKTLCATCAETLRYKPK